MTYCSISAQEELLESLRREAFNDELNEEFAWLCTLALLALVLFAHFFRLTLATLSPSFGLSSVATGPGISSASTELLFFDVEAVSPISSSLLNLGKRRRSPSFFFSSELFFWISHSLLSMIGTRWAFCSRKLAAMSCSSIAAATSPIAYDCKGSCPFSAQANSLWISPSVSWKRTESSSPGSKSRMSRAATVFSSRGSLVEIPCLVQYVSLKYSPTSWILKKEMLIFFLSPIS